MQATYFGKLHRITPEGVRPEWTRTHLLQGTQVLNIPPKSVIRDITLEGGASFKSDWANLRGAVLKFHQDRQHQEVCLIGGGFIVPTAHTLMDLGSFEYTRDVRNHGADIPHEVIRGIAAERLYLVHSSYCHPDAIFLLQGSYTKAAFAEDGVKQKHLTAEGNVLYLHESALAYEKRALNILAGFAVEPTEIVVKLNEGGRVHLWRY
jgi:hypothetical protein